MRSSRLLAASLLVGSGVCQVSIPPHAGVFTGFSRGFNFTASIPFVIVQLDLPLDAFQPGDTASYLVRVNGATALWSIGNAGPLPTTVVISPGDAVDVIGNWSPAAPGNFTANNSSGNSAPYATAIEGVPHTLNRTGWQWDIGAPGWVSTGATGTYLPPATGPIGRVFMYTSAVAGSTVATNTTTGQGCPRRLASFYEFFPAPGSFDLGGNSITMVPTNGGYLVTPGGAPFLAVGSVNPTPIALALGDDTENTVPFTVGSFSGPSGPWTGLNVISNGVVSQAFGNSTNGVPAVATLLSNPQTGFYTQGDWDPIGGTGAGTIWFEESAALTVVTWDNVASGNVPGSQNTFQMQFRANGTVGISWVSMAITGANGGILVGYSPGGPSVDPGNTDLSMTPSMLLYQADTSPLALAGVTRPILNTNWSLVTSNISATGVIGVDVFGSADPGINDLFFLGMPGCGLRASLDALFAWPVLGTTHLYALAIPNSPALVSVHVYTTSAVFHVPPANAFGAITSNGIDGRIGDQ